MHLDQSPEERRVVVNQEDVKNIEDFFNHFRIPIPDFLKTQLDKFKNSPESYTYDDQCLLKTELARAIASSDHELFKDELFTNVLNNCSKEWYDAQFNRDLEEALSDEDQDSSESSEA